MSNDGRRDNASSQPKSFPARPRLTSRQSTSITFNDVQSHDPSIIAEFDLLRSSLRAAEDARDDNFDELLSLREDHEKLRKEHDKLGEELLKQEATFAAEAKELKEMISSMKMHERLAESDRVKLLQERQESAHKEEEMSNTISRLHQRSASASPVKQDMDKSGELGSHLEPSRTDSSNNLLSLQVSNSAKDRQIDLLQQQVEALGSELQNISSDGDPQIRCLQEEKQGLEREISMLREENESYQTLLQDKTMTGEFAHSQFMQSTTSFPKYQSLRGNGKSLDLASEMRATTDTSSVESTHDIEIADRQELEAEVLKLQETNKALTLYVNTIVARMLNTEGFEHLSAKDDRDMQPRSAPRNLRQSSEPSSGGFLQRTKTVLMGRPAAAPPRSRAPAEPTFNSPPPVFKDVFENHEETDTLAASDSRSAQEHSPAPSRSTVETSSSIGKRTISLDGKSPSKSETKFNRGLRPLQSAAAADQISTREARRLSAQFSAPPISEPSGSRSIGKDDSFDKSRRSSWLGWLGSRPEKPGQNNSVTPNDTTNSRTTSLADLRPLQEIDAEIEHNLETQADHATIQRPV